MFLLLLSLVAGCAPKVPSASLPEPLPVANPPGPGRVVVDDELVAHPVAPDTWVVTHLPYHASNVLVASMADGAVLLASSPFETQGTLALLSWIRRSFAPSRIVAVNTHHHFDGTGGNEAYQHMGVETWSSDHTAALLVEHGEAMREAAAKDFDEPNLAERIRTMAVVPAGLTFPEADGLELRFGRELVRVLYPGPAHAPDIVVVHLPARDLVFGGCMVKSGPSIGYLGDADLAAWEPALGVVRRLGARVVVPGHGPVGGPELLDHTAALVRAELDRAR